MNLRTISTRAIKAELERRLKRGTKKAPKKSLPRTNTDGHGPGGVARPEKLMDDWNGAGAEG